MRRLRAVVAEDEPLARETLHEFLLDVPWIVVEGVAPDGEEAVQLVDTLRPDLLFLDVDLPRCLGTTVLKRIVHRPHVVFITADERAAVNAFDVDAVDFLLKPFGATRFQQMIDRVARRFPVQPDQVAVAPQTTPLVFSARRGSSVVLIPAEEIVRFAADDDYTAAFTKQGERHLLDLTLTELETQVGSGDFIRIHRSHLVRRAAIRLATAIDPHRLRVTLRDGTMISASRTGSRRLREVLP